MDTDPESLNWSALIQEQHEMISNAVRADADHYKVIVPLLAGLEVLEDCLMEARFRAELKKDQIPA